MFTTTFAFFACATTAQSALLAKPAVHRFDQRAVDCKDITGALSLLKGLGGPATSFCSSYLKIPATSTIPITSTPVPITSYTLTVTSTVTSSVCPGSGPALGQRKLNARAPITSTAPIAHMRAQFPAPLASQLSSGCSCLSIKPKTTITSTIVAAPSTVNAVTTTTICTTPACAPSMEPCNGACVDVFSSDSSNCGACGFSCPEGVDCVAGTCFCTLNGDIPCNGACPDYFTDPMHCGSCNNVCSGTTSLCLDGTCTTITGP